jgi:hypothetical protein
VEERRGFLARSVHGTGCRRYRLPVSCRRTFLTRRYPGVVSVYLRYLMYDTVRVLYRILQNQVYLHGRRACIVLPVLYNTKPLQYPPTRPHQVPEVRRYCVVGISASTP